MSSAISLVKPHDITSFFIISHQVNLDLPLPLVLPSILTITLPYKSIHWSTLGVSKPCKSISLNLSSIGATFTISRICSFLILYFQVLPQIHLSICISSTLIFCTFCFLVAQHSLPYNMVGLMVIL